MTQTAHTIHDRQHVVVIGAGIGGLSAAIGLAARGFRVTVVEKLNRPGGKMGEVQADGFRWDTGPSVLTMRHVYEQLFKAAGRRLSDYLDLLPLDPITRYFWRDGATIDAVADEEAMCENIRRAFGPRDVDGYRRFMRYVRRLHEVVSNPFLYRHKPGWRDLISLPLADVLKIDALRTMHQAVSAHFRDPHLVQLFDRFATYNGSSPYRAPATLNVIAHVEMAQGAWYPRGGIFRLAQAWERLATELGVEIRYAEPAQEICIQGSAVAGVRLANGSVIRARAVVCNVDYTWAQQTLLPERNQSRADRLEPSCSGFVLMLGVRGAHPELAHHNILFTGDYRREFDDIFDRRIAPRDPTLYLCITSKTDPEHAPAGHENWFVLVNAPFLSPNFDWSCEADRYAQHIRGLLIANLGRILTLAEAQAMVRVERRFTPLDLQETYGGHRGAIYGFSSNTRTTAFMRPGNRDRAIARLYYAGGSVHPGGGVPLVALSGLAAADCLAQDLRL